MKILIRDYSRKQARTFRQRIASFERTLCFLHRRAEDGEDVAQELADTKQELEELHRQRAQGCRIRARIQWAEEGETSSSYFFSLKQKRGQSRLFLAIRSLSGQVVSSVALIARAWVSFYLTLFSAISLDAGHQDFFLSFIRQRLSPAERDLSEGALTLAECKAALDSMPHGKTPGLDGLPAEFYQRFWPLMGQDYVDTMTYCYTSGCLSASQRSGLITLLFKRGDRLEMKNWRPITLLCVDYKIASKAIANRLLQVLPSVISPDQSCGVKGRNPTLNSRMLQDIVSDLNNRGLGGAVLSLDQEKAFDRVDWGYLQRVLARMNFGPSFCQWISLFYTGISSSVLVNGHCSDFFFVSRGVRQGCPLSPLLYIIIAETMACAICADPLIDGFVLPGNRRVKLCQYADDTTIFVMTDGALCRVFEIFQRYELASGAKLNVSKSHGLLIGSWASRAQLPITLQWSSESIIVMGSRLANTISDESWKAPVEKLDSVLSSWRTRGLSFHGRALIVNMMGLSVLWYLASFSVMPDNVLRLVNSLIFSFIWQKKREQLRRVSVTQHPSQGGLGVVHVSHKIQALHAIWVRHLLEYQDQPCMFFFQHYLRVAFAGRPVSQILLLPAPSRTALNLLPPFYRSVMSSWFSLSRRWEGDDIVVAGPGTTVCPLRSLTVRFVYRELVRLSNVAHRCVSKYETWGITVEWHSVWRNLQLWRYVREVRDTNWKIAHGILPTADRLLRYNSTTDPCCHCGQHESLVHLLVECPLAKQLFAWYQTLVRRASPQQHRLTTSEIMVGYDSSIALPPVFPCLLGLIRHRIWIARNGWRFDQSPVEYRSVLAHVSSSLRFVLSVFHRRCPRDFFIASWLAGGIFGHLSPDDVLVFGAELLQSVLVRLSCPGVALIGCHCRCMTGSYCPVLSKWFIP